MADRVKIRNVSKSKNSSKDSILNADLSTILSRLKKGKSKESEKPDVQSFVPQNPEINILPRYVIDKYKLVSLQKRFLFVIAALIVIVASLGFSQKYFLSVAQEDTSVSDSQVQLLNNQISQYTPYLTFEANVDSKRQALVNELSGGVDYGKVSVAMSNAVKSSGVKIQALSIKQTTDPSASACTNPDPFSQVSDNGCVTFTVTVAGPVQAASFAEALRNTPGFVKVNVPSGSSDSQSVEGSVGFDSSFLSTQYNNLGILNNTSAVNSAPADGSANVPNNSSINPGTNTSGSEG